MIYSFLALLTSSTLAAAGVATPGWTSDLHGNVLEIAAYPDSGRAEALLVTLQSGRIARLALDGHVLSEMKLDLPSTAGAKVVQFPGEPAPRIVAADVAGSIYCFRGSGERLWKYSRDGKATDYRVISIGDLDGSGSPDVVLSDSRGHIYAVDSRGKLRIEITTTEFRISAAALADLEGHHRDSLVFGTEDGELYAVRGDGRLLWAASFPGRIGRALPIITSFDSGGPSVLVSNPFVGSFQGLVAFNAVNGAQLWRSTSYLQSYHSTLIANVAASGHPQVLFGDKSTRLFCLDSSGRELWVQHLDGRGIYFPPAVAQLREKGPATLFQVVRFMGANGNSLYILRGDGQLLDNMPLPGGGGPSPLLYRAPGNPLRLAVASASGVLQQFDLAQDSSATILHSAKTVAARVGQRARSFADAGPVQHTGLGTTVLSAATAEAAVLSFRVRDPDGTIHLTLRRPSGGEPTSADLFAAAPGTYRETTTWYRADSSIIKEVATVYRAEPAFHSAPALPQVDAAYKTLASYLHQRAASFFRLGEFDAARHEEAYGQALLEALKNHVESGPLWIRPLSNPWAQHSPTSMLDVSEVSASPLRIHMLGNEYESAALAITNLTPHAVTVSLRIKGLPSHAVKFHSVPYVAPNTTGIPREDPLPLLGDDGLFPLAPAETRELWITFHSGDLTAGPHPASLETVILDSFDHPTEVPIQVDVSPVRLPNRLRYRHCNWLYLANIEDPNRLEATIRDVVDHGTNVFNIPSATVSLSCSGSVLRGEMAAADRLIPKLPGAFFLLDGSVNLQWPASCQPSPTVVDSAYRDALHWEANHMSSLGVSAKDYALYIQDEPGLSGDGPLYQQYVDAVRRAKAADPNIQNFTNPAGGASPDVLAPLDGLVDIWCPDLHLFRQYPDQLGALFRKASQFWHYEAPSDQRRLDPLGFYRVKPWIAFQRGMNGGGYWVYSQTDYWTPDPARETEYGVVYPGPNGPVTSKRWEASRDGIEDFELLSILRDAAQRTNSPEATRALNLILEAVDFATHGQEEASDIGRQLHTYAPDYAKWMEYRERLIGEAEKLVPTP